MHTANRLSALAAQTSQAALTSETVITSASRMSKLPGWYAAYLALAALNMIAVSLSLGLNYRQARLLEESSNSYRSYAELLDQMNVLGNYAIAASTPPSAVFSSRDIDGETARLETAAQSFRDQYVVLRGVVADRLSPAAQPKIVANFPDIDREWDATLSEAQQTLKSFAAGRIAEAGQHAGAKTDRFNKLFVDMMATARVIRQTQLDILTEQQARAHNVSVFGVWLVVGSALVTLTVFAHARRVRRTTQLQKLQRDRLIQALRSARDQAEHAARIKSQFLANMSHEIRTPMNGVLGMLDALSVTPLSTSQAKLLKTANTSADLLLAIIDDVLDFSKIEAGMMVIESVPVNLSDIVQHVHSLYGARAAEKQLNLSYELPQKALPSVRSDATRLTQLLSNLAGNAIKFTAAGEVAIKLEVQTESPDAIRIKFSVRDSGIGIDADAQARLFAPFTQADSSTSRRFGGTGLGLAICKQLVTLLDVASGEIGVNSTPGSGATFYFVLQFPKVANSASPAEKMGGSADSRSITTHFSGHVLVAEDNETNQHVACTMLQNMGLKTTLAVNGREAVEATQRERFDLILMDYHMPELDGSDATIAIRRYEQERGVAHTPIVAFTASVLKDDKERCMNAGMDDFLAKPIRQRTLAAMLEKWLPQQTHSGTVANESPVVETAASAWSNLPRESFDVEQLLDIRAMAGAGFGDLVEQFNSSMCDSINALRVAVETRNAEALRSAGHKLKGAAATMGAKTLSEHGYALEVIGKEARLDAALAQLTLLEKEYAEVQRHLSQCATQTS